MPLSIRIILLVILLLCSAFFSMVESAFSYCNQIRMRISADEGSKSAKLVLKCLDKFDNYIVTNLIGNNIVNNLFSAMSTTLCGLLLLSFMSAEDAKSWGSDKDMVHLTLTGHYTERLDKDLSHVETMLSRFYFYRLKDESLLALCPEDYKNDISLRGEFVRHVFAAELSEEDRARILDYGLRALAGENPID